MGERQPFRPEVPSLTGDGNAALEVWDRALLGPARDFLARPSKAIRHRLVEAGYRIASLETAPLSAESVRLCMLAGKAIEAIHAGSLVIDDIQDGSLLRRGGPTVHRQIGMPLALNVGNWLYFWPLAEVEAWGLPANQELQVYRACHRALLHAHYGQALDVGTRMHELPQSEVEALCLTSLRLKTGALMALSVSLGSILAGTTDTEIKVTEKAASDFGVALQMFDDLGNLLPRKVHALRDPKQWEDLTLGRPSWVWAVVARNASPEIYQSFCAAVRQLPEEKPLTEWLVKYDFYHSGKQQAEDYMRKQIEDWQAKANAPAAFLIIDSIAAELTRAYEQ